jgi:hypothetical protein
MTNQETKVKFRIDKLIFITAYEFYSVFRLTQNSAMSCFRCNLQQHRFYC